MSEKTITIVSSGAPANINSKVSVVPYFDPDISNMGLEKYGLSMHEGIFHEEQLACIERNGQRRYVTGLDEFSPDVKAIKDTDEREAKIKDIRETVAQLEKELSGNTIDPKDEKFWDKIDLLNPTNDQFWSKITLRCGNEKIHLNPVQEPYDLIKIRAIEAGGFSMVAKSFVAAKSSSRTPKFYLDKQEETVAARTELKKLKNKALTELDKMYNKNIKKLMYVAKVVDGNSAQYKTSTPNDILYDNMDNYINGNGVEKNLRRAIKSFLNAADNDMETLKVRAIIKDATFYKLIAPKADGFIYDMKTSTMMGRNPSDCVEFLKNPLNDEILIDLSKQVEKYWN